jgi:hypothetical protein
MAWYPSLLGLEGYLRAGQQTAMNRYISTIDRLLHDVYWISVQMATDQVADVAGEQSRAKWS